MRINKLTASFGKLNNDSIEFKDGLNIIRAPNESGKSTWCAFIRDMLYGVESSERSKEGYLPDKIKYAPWSGAPMQGAMELTAGDKDITITRTSSAKSGPMKEFNAFYTGTGIEVPGLDGVNSGEKLTGVSRDVFRRSAFIEQGGMAISGAPELEKRIASIVSTGEEDTSYSEADERLRSWQRKRRYNKRGRLAEIEGELDKAKSSMSEMDDLAREKSELQEAIEQTETRCADLEIQVAESRKYCRKRALDNLTQSRAELSKAMDRYTDLATRAKADRAALEHNVLGETEPASAEQRAGKDKARCEELLKISEDRGSMSAVILCVFIAAAAIIAGALVAWYGYAVAVIAAVAAIILSVNVRKKSAVAAEAFEERSKILYEYSAHSEEEIDEILEEFRDLYAAAMASEQEAKEAEIRLSLAKDRQTKLETETLSDLDFSNGGTEAARLGRELAEAKSERERLASEIAVINGRLAAMGDPVVIKSSIENMQAEHDTMQSEYDAIALAVDMLSEADGEIQSRFSPELGRCAAEYMSIMTGGRYDKLLISRDFTARAGANDDSVPRQAEYLSAGTMDLLYLAVRLAVCRLALPAKEACPIILDDALVNFDNEREKQAMHLLEEISKERQIILFTCKTE